MQQVEQSSLGSIIKKKQVLDPLLMKIKDDVCKKKVMAFEISGDGILRYQRRLCFPHIDGLYGSI